MSEGRAVRVVASILLIGLAGIVVPGCKSSNSNTSKPPPPFGSSSAAPAPKSTGTAVAATGGQPGAPLAMLPAGVNGLIAGQIIDGYERPHSGAYVLVEASKPTTAKGAPISQDVAADNQGYFTIQGLEAGRSYKLVARVKEGDRILAGMAYVTPPNPRVVIRISEDYALANIPPPPPPPSWNPGRLPSEPGASIDKPLKTDRADIGSPIRSGSPAPPSTVTPMSPGFVSAANTSPPTMNIRGGESLGAPTPDTLPSPGGRSGERVFFDGTSQQVSNFALPDIDGKTWELKNDRRGKLLLLEFWGTDCPHCISAKPAMVAFEKTYGPKGLEIVGIAYERGAPEEQVRKVRTSCRSRGCTYTMLLGDLSNCPVHAGLKVYGHPTYVLLDESGRVVFQSSGFDPNLEQEIRKRLGVR